MTAGTTHRIRRRLSYTFALVGAWTIGFAGLAPAAVAEDVRAKQWYLNAMHAEDIWKKETGEGIKVAVIDSGVNSSTPSLKGQVLKGFDATETDGKTDDYVGHGTTMAELIAGTGRSGGLQGLAPGAKIIPIRIRLEGAPFPEKNVWDEADAIRAAADSDAQIINMSYGGIGLTSRLEKAVKYAHSKGKLMFAAVGNSGDEENMREYPGAFPEVVGVAATNSEGTVGDFSQHGDFVDIAAPGLDIPGWCDATFTRYCDGKQGTSHATAIASATAALIWSAHPNWTANQVLRVMFESAARGDDWKPGTVSNYLGYGIVRPNAHITRGLGKPGDPNVSPLPDMAGASGASPSASASPGSSAPASSQAPAGDPSPDTAVAGSSSASADDGGGLPVWAFGAIAAAVVIGGGTIAVVRKRRRA
ncbi:S8 family serine peptidase [Streptomyces sp. TRM64462]|uniref:S8 family serine peptidase n=1 Tax=Streptomyces sp. TRM64462 TaxID=2741726 RepID=UPI0015861F7B|nr:S8 family serine peptidase [Streptomyces sp. TRM64462]